MPKDTAADSLPEGWQRCRLPDFVALEMGQSPPSRTYNDQGVGLPFFQGKAEFGDLYPSIEKYCSEPNKIAQSGATLLSVRAPVGPTNLAPEKCCIGRGLAALHPEGGMDSKFVLYLFRSIEPELSSVGTGSTFKAVTKSFLQGLEVDLPPIQEQTRIVAKVEELLSELDNGVANLERARQQLAIYRQTLLKQAFEGKLTARWREEQRDRLEDPGQLLDHIREERRRRDKEALGVWQQQVACWEGRDKLGPRPTRPKKYKQLDPVSPEELEALPEFPKAWRCVRLAEIAHIGSGMSVSSRRKIEDPIEVPYLRVANVQRGYLDLCEIKSMRVERTQLHRLALAEWDVLFNEGGDRDKLGRGWIWQGQIDPCITQNHVFRASPVLPSETHAKWISYWGNSFGQRYFDRQGKQTTNLASINKTVLSRFPVPLPSMREQIEIIQTLEARMTVVDRLDDEIETSFARLDVLRQSILKRAFTGKLVAQNRTEEPASTLLERIARERKAIKNGKKKRKTGT